MVISLDAVDRKIVADTDRRSEFDLREGGYCGIRAKWRGWGISGLLQQCRCNVSSIGKAKQVWTVGRLLKKTDAYLEEKQVDSHRLSAELLLAHALGCERIKLYATFDQPVPELVLARYRELVKLRANHVPVGYLTGKAYFYSLELTVNPDVLIPRPETELLVEQVITICRTSHFASPIILEIGTGSGCVGVALAKNLPHASLVATDISERALEIAKANATTQKVSERMRFAQGDLFEAVGDDLRPANGFDFIVSNPPYISREEMADLPADVREYEPRVALLAGEDALAVHRRIVAEAKNYLARGGRLLMELGQKQAGPARNLLKEAGYLEQVRTVHDLAGHERVVIGEKKIIASQAESNLGSS